MRFKGLLSLLTKLKQRDDLIGLRINLHHKHRAKVLLIIYNRLVFYVDKVVLSESLRVWLTTYHEALTLDLIKL